MLAFLGVMSADAAMSAEIANQKVAKAMQSIMEAEKKVYSQLIVGRERVHGCRVAKDMATLKKNKATIPNVKDFQSIVATAVANRDGGKYAYGLDVHALAEKSGSMEAKKALDLLHAYAEASRTNYTASVIARAKDSECGTPSEFWAEEGGLPLPAQYTRAVADAVSQSGVFTYSLLSEWPINKQNAPRTEFEKKAVEAVQDREPYYGSETLGDQRYFSAAYADVATNKTCVSCHNNHVDSPKTDFEMKDVMGGLLMRFPLD